MVESNEHVMPWREAIKAAALAQPVRDLDGPLVVTVVLTVAKPLRTKDLYPITRASGDVDKHLRCVLDALQDAGTIVDDARVVWSSVCKWWPGQAFDSLDQPGAVITVEQWD